MQLLHFQAWGYFNGECMIWKGYREDFRVKFLPHKYYVYMIRVDESSHPIYIGKGSNARCAGHRASGAGNRGMKRLVTKYPNYYIEILSSSNNEDTIYQLEKSYISKFGKKCEGGLLLNFSDGGRNTAGGIFNKYANRRALSLRKSFLSGKTIFVEGFIFPSKRLAANALGRDRNHIKFLIKEKRAFLLDGDIEDLLLKEEEYHSYVAAACIKYAPRSKRGTYMGCKKKVRIGSIVYESLTEAAQQNSISVSTVANRISRGNQKDTYYVEDSYE